MTEPLRLVEMDPEGADELFARSLLRAGMRDGMAPEARRKLLGRIVAGAGAATVTATKGSVVAKLLASTLFKGLAGGALLVAIAVFVAGRSHPPPVVAPPPAPSPSIVAPPIAPPLVETVAPSAVPPAVVRSAAVAPPAPSASTAGAEAAILDEARAALRDGDPSAALGALDRHRRAYPRPALADEAFVLRAEALSANGDAAGARKMVEPWLAAHPASPYAPRLRRLLARGEAR